MATETTSFPSGRRSRWPMRLTRHTRKKSGSSGIQISSTTAGPSRTTTQSCIGGCWITKGRSRGMRWECQRRIEPCLAKGKHEHVVDDEIILLPPTLHHFLNPTPSCVGTHQCSIWPDDIHLSTSELCINEMNDD